MGEPLGSGRVPAWRRYLRFWGSDPARDLDDELRFHLAARCDEFVAAGMSPAQARAEAERRLGDLGRVRAECSDIDSRPNRERSMRDVLHHVRADLRYATRQLRRNGSLTIAAVLCLALGIGANTAIFSVVDAVLYRPLPFRDPGRLVLVGEGLPRFGDQNFGVISMPEYWDYRRLDGRTFSGSAIYELDAFSISDDRAEPERVNTARVSENLFEVLGLAPTRGRAFTAADADTSAPPVAVISDALWHRRFGADASVLGRRIDIEGRPATIVGVLPPAFQFPLAGIGGDPADLFVPIKRTAAVEQLRGNSYNTYLVARLAPGVSLARARHDVAALAASLPTLHPDLYRKDWLTVADAFPLRDHAVQDLRRPLLILLAAVGLVLLVACMNVSSLLLARAAARDREISVRQALGASLGRLVQQFLAESAVLVAAGTTLGLLVAVWLARLLAAHAPGEVLDGYAVAVDRRVLAVTTGVAIVTTVAFSLLPAMSRRRGALAPALHDGARGSTAGPARQRGRRSLVVTQIGLALLLSTGAGLMIRSFVRARSVDPGFEPRHVVVFRTGIPSGRYPRGQDMLQVEQRTIDALRQLPGVRSVSATSQLPLASSGESATRMAFSLEGEVLPKIPVAVGEMVFAEYFGAMGIRIREGRAFTSSDAPGALPVAIVNETLARRYFGSRGAVGRRLKNGSPESKAPWLTIVGVATDVRQLGLDQPSDPEIYVPAAQLDSNSIRAFLRSPAFVIRSSGDLSTLTRSVQRTLRRVDPDLPIVRLEPLTDVVDVSMSSRWFNTVLLAGFALLALILAAIGIYGLIAYSVVQRTREIGVRLAVGAVPHEIVRLVLGQSARLATVGVVVGLAAALLLTRLMRSLLFDVSPLDVTTFAAAAVVLLLVAVLASYLPARRASRIDPQTAIRAD